MKVEEVHIKDWVNLSDEMGNIAPFRVNSVQCGDVDAENYITVSDFFNPFYEGEFQPILITAEILEKNGFVNDGSRWHKLDGNNFTVMCNPYYTVVRIVGNDCALTGQAEYIHQLQQALRLCGIDKEIKV